MQLIILFFLTTLFLGLLSLYFYKKYNEVLKLKEKVYQELSEAKQNLQVLENNIQLNPDERILQSITRHFPFGVILTDEKGNIYYINPATEVLLGLSFSQVIHKSLSQFIKMIDVNQNIYTYTQLLAENQNRHTPLKLQFNTARKHIWLNVQISHYDLNGQSYFLLILTNLEKTNDQIQKIKAFYSQAAHDLKTPITIIRNTLELLIDKSEQLTTQKQREMLVDAKYQTLLLQNLVEDILNVAKIEQGKIQPNLRPVLINEIIDKSLKKHAPLIKEKSLGLEFNMAESNSIKVMADPHLLETIIDNLISNAIKYTFTGMIILKIRPENSWVILNVIDSGVGIDKEHQSLLFNIFQPVGEARRLSLSKSTGLGLYIAREMARLMKGDIVLTSSEPGKGSTFTLKLPLAYSHDLTTSHIKL